MPHLPILDRIGRILIMRRLNRSARRRDWTEISKEAHTWLPARTAGLASKYGFSYNRIAIKHNKTNWGSCSSKHNINLNMTLMLLPEYLRDYVILHELSHLKVFNHGAPFHKLLDKLCLEHIGRSEKLLRKEIRGYHAYSGEKIA